ncbi:hypothetical protein KUTeg_003929 [Tegillarca granosa]|uniref:Neutral ceramidase n=1 Tax=Tegillarca granosa TaxID=220873 RepID=A0ABQ9FT14_TEGGR|nr:hypothetical protein KUTeg_003929 [Tegillarca granosa]
MAAAMGTLKLFLVILAVCAVFRGSESVETNYVIGTGIADITGPAAEVNMMGYANPAQTTHGLHLRQYSRAFIITDSKNSTPIVFVSTDSCMQSQGLKQESIERAHSNMKKGNIYMKTEELLESNINRSPTAYLLNPAEERAKYKYDVDKNITVLKIVDENNEPIGMISWFAVHCTSMNNTNHLISSDNKGLASQLFEATMNPGKFPGQNELCVAFGPGKDMFDSTRIIANNQLKKAMDMFKSEGFTQLTGPVDFRHTYVNMTDVEVQVNSTYKTKTCKTAMGYAFAAGTTDGPGAFDFKQGTTSTNPLWSAIVNFIRKPSETQVKCHHPKPILLDTGEVSLKIDTEPCLEEEQGMQSLNLYLQTLKSGGFPEDTVSVIAGLSNDYADYVTTPEEYQQQRYEGASTIYGPYTLPAYIQQFTKLAESLAKLEDTFLRVEKKQGQNYVTVFMDSQWETKFEWHRTSTLFGESQSTITWDIPANQEDGTYRISYYGNSKSIDGTVREFNGHSKDFVVQKKKMLKKTDKATKKMKYSEKLNKKYLKYLEMMKYKKEKKNQVNAVIDKLSKNIVVM